MSAFPVQSGSSVNGHYNPNPRPSLPRSNSTPSWAKNVSMESLRSPRTLQPPFTSTYKIPLLRKRHSTNVFHSSPPDRAKTPVPVPGIPPIRPLRNPARAAIPAQDPLTRTVSSKPSTRRPSTSSDAREEVTPWEFAPGPTHDKHSLANSVDSGSSSPVSPRPRKSLTTSTGPLSEVTPWEMYPVRRSATSRSSLTSGFIDEVTPWEMHPVPTIVSSRSTLATGPVEDVTPWELAPEPTPAAISEKRFSNRLSASSSQGKLPTDITFIRRRKSTSAKSTKTRSNFFGYSYNAPGDVSGSGHSISGKSSIKSASKRARATPSLPPLPPLSPFPPSNSHKSSTTPQADLRFSTADRTILEELKRNLKAKDAQFVMKGEGSLLGPALGSRGKKHHAFPKEEVPYPRSYGREIMDLDVWETVSCQALCESLTWHVFETPPTKVLDLGCGTGTWVLSCARTWKDCHFVGLDIVPLQPDLHQVGSSDLASRITWKHHNFLEGLSFPDDEFDFVHIKRIALGVPEDQWDHLFEEICRVLKPGGAFEMIEEDLFFPGKLDNDDESDYTRSERRSSLLSSHRQSSQSHSSNNLESLTDSEPSFLPDDASPLTPTTATFPPTPLRSNSPTAQVAVNEEFEKEEAQDLLSQVMRDFMVPSDEASVINDTLSTATTRGHLQVNAPKLPFSSSAVSLGLPSVTAASSDLETSAVPKIRTRSRGLSLTASLSVPDIKFPGQTSSTSQMAEVPPSVPSVPLLLRTIPKPPANPHDHSLLEAIYIRLLESRFINNSPLALLANYVGFYFKDVRTHPPLQYHFPAVPRGARSTHRKDSDDDVDCEESGSDSDDARDAILPSPVIRVVKRHSRQNREEEEVPISEENGYVSVRSLVEHSSPYITIDESRAPAISPAIKGMFPDTPSAKLQRGYLLPNTTMHLDLKTLNLHLALRAAEIVACSESMWDWVYERKERAGLNRPVVRGHRSGSGSVEMPVRRLNVSRSTRRDTSAPFENDILDLTREEFDGLVNWFEMDMRDKCAISDALGDRFSWNVAKFPVSEEREVFEKACEKWDKWEQEQGQLARTLSQSSHHAYATGHPSPAVLEGSHPTGYPTSGEQRKKRASSILVTSPPQRLSRVMRVFVAWKAG